MFAESFLYALEMYVLDTTKVKTPLDYLNGTLKMQSLDMYPIHLDSFYLQLV